MYALAPEMLLRLCHGYGDSPERLDSCSPQAPPTKTLDLLSGTTVTTDEYQRLPTITENYQRLPTTADWRQSDDALYVIFMSSLRVIFPHMHERNTERILTITEGYQQLPTITDDYKRAPTATDH